MLRLISFLGTSDYKKTTYTYDNDQFESRFVALALAKLLNASEVIILATPEAKERNAKDLIEDFKSAALKEPTITDISNGSTTEGLWKNFDIITNQLLPKEDGKNSIQVQNQDQNKDENKDDNKNDETVLDITHGFRSLPFFAGAVVAYVRAISSDMPSIRILYGVYNPNSQDPAPIWDLTPFVELLDWTHSLNLFLQSGRADKLAERTEEIGRELRSQHRKQSGEKIEPWIERFGTALRDFADALATVRVSKLLLNGNNQKSLANWLLETLINARPDIEKYIPPVARVLDKLQNMIEPLKYSEDHLAGASGKQVMLELAKLYYKLGRYAETGIILREGLINLFAPPEATRPGQKIRHIRERVEHIVGKRAKDERESFENNLFNLRNDIEHGGFSDNPRLANKIKNKLNEFIDIFSEIQPKQLLVECNKPTTWFVSRHRGAIEWAKRKNINVDKLVEHLDIDEVKPGDTVIGTLPLHLAEQVCERGAIFLNLTIDVPPENRGKELSADDMERFGARCEKYFVKKIKDE